jgi:hypothetical protein
MWELPTLVLHPNECAEQRVSIQADIGTVWPLRPGPSAGLLRFQTPVRCTHRRSDDGTRREASASCPCFPRPGSTWPTAGESGPGVDTGLPAPLRLDQRKRTTRPTGARHHSHAARPGQRAICRAHRSIRTVARSVREESEPHTPRVLTDFPSRHPSENPVRSRSSSGPAVSRADLLRKMDPSRDS